MCCGKESGRKLYVLMDRVPSLIDSVVMHGAPLQAADFGKEREINCRLKCRTLWQLICDHGRSKWMSPLYLEWDERWTRYF